uniref:Uncharacterized protein n=1 Tax=Chaetoceros debilis TaxID=122233 RepID=A0A7S3QEQ0_9STRA
MLDGNEGVTGYARDYGFAVFGVGSTGPFTGDGGFGLDFPANGIINPTNPTPCSASDSKDYVYLKGILDFIDGMSDKLDNTKVFVEGFSQSSMYAAYFTVCFADRIAGMWQGGSALAKTYYTPVTPGFQGQCSNSDYTQYGRDCCEEHFCKDCTWWPIYPRTCQHKIISCIGTYTNDEIACGGDYYQYDAMTTEGNDARMLSFAPNTGGNNGGHEFPENGFDWLVGCLGIVDSCNTTCETSFLACMGGNVGSEKFRSCRERMGTLNGCSMGNSICAPTLNMMRQSEVPEVVNLSQGRFGTSTGVMGTAMGPKKPNCKFGSFDQENESDCKPPNNAGPATGLIEACESVPTSDPDTSSPVVAPTPSPPSPNPPSPSPPFSCIDNCSFQFRLAWKPLDKGCDWLTKNKKKADARKAKYCSDANILASCSATCSTSCVDDLDFTFILDWNQKEVQCNWITKNKDQLIKRQDTYCNMYSGSCSASCGRCPS